MMEAKVFSDTHMECQKAVLHTHQGPASNVFYLRPEDVEKIINENGELENHLSHVTTQGAYALLTGMVALLAYWMAGIYETPYVIFIAIIILFISMTLAMRFFGEDVQAASSQ